MKKLITIPDELFLKLKATAHLSQINLQDHIIGVLEDSELSISEIVKISDSLKQIREDRIQSTAQAMAKVLKSDECKTYFKK